MWKESLFNSPAGENMSDDDREREQKENRDFSARAASTASAEISFESAVSDAVEPFWGVLWVRAIQTRCSLTPKALSNDLFSSWLYAYLRVYWFYYHYHYHYHFNIYMKKVCSRCVEEKDYSEFPIDKRNKSKIKPYCKKCANKPHIVSKNIIQILFVC